ncbi:MAG: hypothetical protein HY710_15395 [Candidatus Latescibacteria bacterium]|nr:hypothetical protein [Candidatus Latescibacterota bacterium]
MLIVIRLAFLFLIIGVMGMFGCREDESRAMNKLDPRLKLQVQRLENAPVSVMLRVTAELDSTQLTILARHGVTIQSHIGPVYVCQIPLRSILPVAREPFVVMLEAPKEMKPQ